MLSSSYVCLVACYRAFFFGFTPFLTVADRKRAGNPYLDGNQPSSSCARWPWMVTSCSIQQNVSTISPAHFPLRTHLVLLSRDLVRYSTGRHPENCSHQYGLHNRTVYCKHGPAGKTFLAILCKLVGRNPERLKSGDTSYHFIPLHTQRVFQPLVVNTPAGAILTART